MEKRRKPKYYMRCTLEPMNGRVFNIHPNLMYFISKVVEIIVKKINPCKITWTTKLLGYVYSHKSFFSILEFKKDFHQQLSFLWRILWHGNIANFCKYMKHYYTALWPGFSMSAETEEGKMHLSAIYGIKLDLVATLGL